MRARAIVIRTSPNPFVAVNRADGCSDYLHYTATVHTTVGSGDLVPRSGLRLLTAFTSLTGLVMITWSASLTFVEMQRARALDARE